MRRTDEQRGDWKEWRRRRAWELFQQGWSQKQIAEALGVTEGAVSQWMKQGRERGEEGLRGTIAAGPAARLTPEQMERLPRLLEQGAEAYGFAGAVWTTERARGRADPAAVWRERAIRRMGVGCSKPSSTVCNSQSNEPLSVMNKPSRPGKRSDGPR